MDLAYDHIQESAYLKEADETDRNAQGQPQSSLNNDLQDAYKAFSASPWGARIGGFLGNVVKQGESVYSQAQKELAEVSGDASKGFTDLRESIINRTRSISLNTAVAGGPAKEGEDSQTTPTTAKHDESEHDETVLSRLRTEAAKRLKDLQKAEDAADEALLRFGSNVRDFLKDAISVAPPENTAQGSSVLFESKDATGKRAFHASRFDAQLHVIHTTPDGFTRDPSGAEYESWAMEFDAEKKTDEISKDLAKYPELRSTMEALVPATIAYGDFWKRYYFLRHGIETAENRRRELLKAAEAEDEVGWDDESDDEASTKDVANPRASTASTATIQPPESSSTPKATGETRKSNDEKSQADSEASYDVVGAASGKTSQAPSSPKDAKKDDDSDDDWE